MNVEDMGRELVQRWRRRGRVASQSTQDGEAPLSFSQEGIWLFEQLHPGTPVNNLTFCGIVDGPLDIAALTAAVHQVCQRHSILRTTFTSEPRQVVHSDLVIEPEVVVLSSEDEAIQLAREAAREPFDLVAGPLLRVTVYQLPSARSVLSVTAHHLIADGWSLGVFLHELTAVGDVPWQYADLARQNRVAPSPADLAYWRDQLSDHSPLQLPTDYPRPAKPEFHSAFHSIHIGYNVLGRVRALAAETGTTPFMVLLAGFHVLLGRLSGGTDVTVGSPTATRQRVSAPQVIGPLVNMLPLRVDLSGAVSFREVLDRVRHSCLGAYAHQDVPFEKLVEEARSQSALSPLFQAMLVHQDAPADLRLGGVSLTPVLQEPSAVHHDLELYLWSGDDGITGFLGYDKDLFTAATAQRLVDRYVTLLSSAVAEPSQPVADLTMTFPGEVELRTELSEGKQIPVPDRLVHEWFELQADRTPDAVAVRAVDGELTYRQLDQRANQLAHHLRTHCAAGPETLVAICLPRTLDLITALFAVLKAGAAYVPIDPAYPTNRITYILNDAKAATLITTNDINVGDVNQVLIDHATGPTTRLTPTATKNNLAYVIYTSGSTGQPKGVMIEHHQTTAMITWALDTFTPTELTNVLASTSVCFDLSIYEIFTPLATGGSITLTEHNALDLITNPTHGTNSPHGTSPTPTNNPPHGADPTRTTDPTPGTGTGTGTGPTSTTSSPLDTNPPHGTAPTQGTILTPTTKPTLDANPDLTIGTNPPHVTDSTLETKPAPTTNRTSTTNSSLGTNPPHGADSTPTHDSTSTHDTNITLINTVPSIAQELLTSNALPTSASTINLAGEPLSPTLVRALYQQPHIRAVHNLYGPSEDTTYSTHAHTTPNDHRTPIGRPIHNTQAHILDANLRPVPIGSIGELYLSGSGITRGYHNQPTLTAERYLPGPQGQRLYRTGDHARWRPDQQLDYHGRTDHQIKHHGHRIEPTEIETTLHNHPHINQAAVTIKNDTLTAYIVAPQLNNDPTPLQTHLHKTLPTHMIPTLWVFLDTLPLTPNHKIDRNALPNPTPTTTPHQPPRTQIERLIATIWQHALDITTIGIHDNFFTLGGHSLLATRITNQLQTQLHITIPPHTLFEHPTIAELAHELTTASGIKTIPRLQRTEEDGRIILPASFGQERLWFLTQLDPQTTTAYHMTGAATLHGPLNTTALHHALHTTTQRHETLRTTLHHTTPNTQQPTHTNQTPTTTHIHHTPNTQPTNAPQSDPDTQQTGHTPRTTTTTPEHTAPTTAHTDQTTHSTSATGHTDQTTRTTLATSHTNQTSPTASATSYTYQSVHSASPTLNHVTANPSQLTDILNHEATHPFNLTQGPLLRATLIHHTHNHHTLIITMHHTISDGWSLTILLNEIGVHYRAWLSGTEEPLPPLEIQYADFASWQRDRFGAGELAEQVGYWRKQLAGSLPLELPTDFPRPPRQTFNGAAVPVHVDRCVAERIDEIARAEGTTVFVVLLVAYQILLARVSGQDDISVGSPVSGRQHPDVENLIGFFVNTLVFRSDLGRNPTFLEVLGRARRTCLDAYTHQEVPFEKLVAELQVERDLSRSPLCQAMLVHQESPLPTLDIDGVECTFGQPDQHTSQFDLTLRLEQTADGLHGELVYNTDLFESSTAERLVARYVVLLDRLTASPNTHLADVSAPPPEEVTLLAELTQGKQIPVPDRLVHEWFEIQADQTPDAVAVRAVDGELTYRQLDQRANQLAHHLRHQHHITPETLVGVCLPRTLDLIVALFAVLKSGAAYVPIDPAYPTNRITYILNDANAKALITTNDTNVGDVNRVLIDHATGPTTRLIPAGDKQNLAYVIYTSGSTGQPKGVMIEHHQTTAMITWALNTFTPTELTNVLASTSVCFDLSIYEIFAPLAAGGSITLTEHNALDLTINPDLGTNITLINTVPSVAEELLISNALPANASTINLAGEPLSPTLVRALYDQPHVKAVHNLYGPSEDTTYSTHARTRPKDQRTPIGRPIHNTQAHILDANLRPVPIGSIGELYLSGAGITRGYHNQPTLTAERYLPSPQGQRLYRTGDLARWRPDQQLDYHGRTDHQIKHHGHRIEPTEIETTLHTHPHINQAAVIKHTNTLTAYIVAPELDNDPTALRAYLQQSLPTHMIPTAWVFLDTLPLTPNGKIDRKALPDPTPTTTSHEPPRNETEQQIATIWQHALNITTIGIHDNFFTLGGHSLLATRITNQLNIPLHTLFQHPTIAELAHELTGHQRTTIPQLDRIDKNGTTTLPASFGQERLWFLTQLDPQTTTAYHMTGAATLHGPLNTTALKHALHTTTQRHETLRTTLHHHTSRSGQTTNPQATGYTYQSVHAASPTLNHVTADHSQLTDILNHEATHPFNLTQGPLFRATLIHHTHNHHTLIITMHHTISDGWSLTILLREITTAYTALVRGQAAELPSLRVQYADFAAWQRDRLARGELEESISYWRKQLAGIAPLELPTDLPRPARQTFGGATRSVDVGEDLVRALEELARAEGVTVFMVLLAVFHTLLSRVCGQKDVAVGSPISGREHPDVEDLVGFFVNTLVLRADLGGTPSFREVLRRVRQVCLEAYAHQDVPFEKLVEELQPERDLSRSPLFQVMFVVDEAAPQYTMPDLEIHELRPEQRSSQFELTLRLMRSDSGLHGDLVYNTDLFAEDTAQRLADRYVTMLSEVVADPDQRIAELPVMSLDETKQLSTLTRGTDTRVPDLLVHEWFEAQADRTPDATAVRAVDGELTYRQLDQQANQLAHHLRHQHHITPETLVGVCLPRTLDLIVALFAVLKTGAAYVPIDPAYPTNRITYILNDTKAKALITTCDTNVGPYERILVDQTGLTSRLTPTADKHNLAYVIYTSGSTGQPKGVMIEHHQTTAMITWALNTYTTELTNVLASTSVCFDLSIYEIFAPLAAGGSITLTEHNALDLTTNPDLGTNITLINTVPSIAQELMTAEALPASAATINLAGEALSPTLVRALYDQPHVKAVHNLYGPSEDTTYSTHAHTTSQDNRTPIGQPIHNTQAHILDANLRPVPIGSIGELYLSGAGITRGYHNQPTLTAERYLPSPQGQRLYRTGDLARWRPDQQLDYHGRTDHQIKHHGHRIEPTEIETTLHTHPATAQAAVAIKNDTLTAYIVAPQLNSNPTPLLNHLRNTLPTPMIPTAWIFLNELPLTPNRKIDRNALPNPTPTTTPHQPPRTHIERLIATIWQHALNITTIGIHDNFFTLGGHSLLATRITNQLNIPLHTLFQHPTIAELAEVVPENAFDTTSIPRLKRTGRVEQPKERN